MIPLSTIENKSRYLHFMQKIDNCQLPNTIPLLFDSPKRNSSRASEYITPFILKVYRISENPLTLSISKCITDLDNLAIQIDTIIDSKKTQIRSTLSVENINGLESKIVNCLNYLKGLKGYYELVSSTLDCVNLSFKFNTIDRHKIYDFSKNTNYSCCTTYYLFPLIRYLTSIYNVSFDPRHIYLLIANYVQMLDDFVDLFLDIKSGIRTPITEEFVEVKHLFIPSSDVQTPFTALVNNVKLKLAEILHEIDIEICRVGGKQHSYDILKGWYKFHYNMEILPVPTQNNLFDQLQYLKKLNDITPPMLCYIS